MQSFGKMGLGPRGGVPARPWGQRIGSNDKHNEWKLFIGQVPLEVGSVTPARLRLCGPVNQSSALPERVEIPRELHQVLVRCVTCGFNVLKVYCSG